MNISYNDNDINGNSIQFSIFQNFNMFLEWKNNKIFTFLNLISEKGKLIVFFIIKEDVL